MSWRLLKIKRNKKYEFSLLKRWKKNEKHPKTSKHRSYFVMNVLLFVLCVAVVVLMAVVVKRFASLKDLLFCQVMQECKVNVDHQALKVPREYKVILEKLEWLISGGGERTVQTVELLWFMKVTSKFYIHFLESSLAESKQWGKGGGGE